MSADNATNNHINEITAVIALWTGKELIQFTAVT